MELTHGIKPIVTSGLVLCLDAGNIKSYPGIGTAWTDLSGRGGIGTLTNGPTYNSANGGSFSFDGIDDFVSSVSNLTLANNFSVSLWLRSTNSYPVQEKYISLGSDRIVIQSNEIGNLSSYVTDSTQQNLLTWGNNGFGQLGINNTAISATPVTTFAGGTTWKQVASGGYHTAAIKTDGSLWTWGRNTSGQLGDFSNTNRSTPVTTFAGGTNWKQVTCGGLHTAAIKTDGTLWTWGAANEGRLGTNDTTNRLTPVTTFAGGNNWKQVSTGNDFMAAVKSGLNVDLSFSGLFVVPEYETLTYTLSSANLTITGNGTNTVNVYKNANGGGWNEQIYSLVPFTAPCTIEYNKQAASDLMIGWNEDPLTNANYVSLDYASYTNNTGSYQVYHNGNAQNPGGTWSTADKLYIVYNTDGTIRHYTGSKLLFSADYGTGKIVYVDTTFYDVTTNGFDNLKVIRAAWNGTAYGA